MTDSQWYTPWNHYVINILEDIVVFLGLKLFDYDNSYVFSCSRNKHVLSKKPQ